MSDVCQELQNIKYQTMLLNHNSKIYETTPNTNNIEVFLENEKASNKKKPWSKLGKAIKLKKITEYVDMYSKKENLNEEQKKQLKQYLYTCLNRKKLQRQKDVIYNLTTCKITCINGLIYNKTANRFTLKKQQKTNNIVMKNKTKTKNIKDKKKSKDKKKATKTKIDIV